MTLNKCAVEREQFQFQESQHNPGSGRSLLAVKVVLLHARKKKMKLPEET